MNDLWLLPEGEDRLKILEEMFSIPVEQRMEWLAKQVENSKIKHIGTTEKSAPELAIAFIKKGIKAKSYTRGKNKMSDDCLLCMGNCDEPEEWIKIQGPVREHIL